MACAPSWGEAEIAVVARGHDKSIEVLQNELPLRSKAAIEAVRVGMHYYHLGEDHGFLSKRAQDYLNRKSETLTCALCGDNY